MLKRLPFLLLLLCMSCIVNAELRVFSVSGNVSRWTGTEWEELYKGKALQPTDRIRMTEYAQLSIADDKQKLLLPVQAEGEYTVEQLVITAKQHKTGFLKSCWNTVVAILNGDLVQEQQGGPGTEYRGERTTEDTNKSIACELQKQLYNNDWSSLSLQTYYRIELQLIDMQQGNLRTNLYLGELVRPLVTNHSNTPLFVGIVDYDGKGDAVSVLPTAPEQMFTSFLIPPFSTVILPFPFVFNEIGTEHLYLIASPELFNMERVLELLKETSGSAAATTPIGLAKAVIQIM